jgi:hypothetical protein
MRNERVVIANEGAGRMTVLARNIFIPDVRHLAPFLNKVEGSVVYWSHESASLVLRRIVQRQRWNSVKEPFEIDVPDLHEIAKGFPREEQALLMEFWHIYDALVRHFLPKATPRVYFFDGGVRGGVRYHGVAFYTPEPKK